MKFQYNLEGWRANGSGSIVGITRQEFMRYLNYYGIGRAKKNGSYHCREFALDIHSSSKLDPHGMIYKDVKISVIKA